MPQPDKIIAIIPCYNEAASIDKLLREFERIEPRCDTVVIDDGSADATADIARHYTHVIQVEKNSGILAALKVGMAYASERGYGWCIQIDGDGQHIPAEIIKMLEAYRQSAANIIVGSRYCGKPFALTGGLRRAAAVIMSGVFFMLFQRQWIWDPFSGMRMMDKKAIDYMREHIREGEPDIVLLGHAMRAGLSVREVPVVMRKRQAGNSSLEGYKGVVFFLQALRIAVVARRP